MDLIAELDRKRLARHRVFVGAGLEKSLGAGDGATIEIPPVTEVGPGGDCILGVVVSQLIGLFRSVREGLDPDAPSPSGAISRVVEDFPIH
jgi:tagatose-6-phosphate ketose/aldose isomerase